MSTVNIPNLLPYQSGQNKMKQTNTGTNPHVGAASHHKNYRSKRLWVQKSCDTLFIPNWHPRLYHADAHIALSRHPLEFQAGAECGKISYLCTLIWRCEIILEKSGKNLCLCVEFSEESPPLTLGTSDQIPMWGKQTNADHIIHNGVNYCSLVRDGDLEVKIGIACSGLWCGAGTYDF